jgi:23S rRNA (uracil1939-C5)-methyltransferase
MTTETDSRASATPRRGDMIEFTIDDWGDRGRGIGRVDGMVVLTDHGLPGDRVRARVAKRKRRHLEAFVDEILEPSPHRIEASCPHFGLCGGCRLLDYDYEQQLQDKVRHMTEQMRRIGLCESVPEIEIMPCDPPDRYRNKMEFSFGGRNGELTLGLHPRGNFRDAFDLTECMLTDERAPEIVAAVRDFFKAGPEESYDPVAHTGYLRYLVVRFGCNTDEVLVNLVTADAPLDRSAEFAASLRARCPYVTTALWTVNAGRANTAMGETREVFFGRGNLRERLGEFEFEIAPAGFFQTNTHQALKLFERVVEYADPDGQHLLDLYSGAGAISFFLSKTASLVTGVESFAESVTAGQRNAERNGVVNCRFVCADVLGFLKGDDSADQSWTTIVADPPRAGLHPRVVRILKERAPKRLVYVSCNPANLARDLALFGDTFRLARLSAVDMFPHTPHIEAVALLERTYDD